MIDVVLALGLPTFFFFLADKFLAFGSTASFCTAKLSLLLAAMDVMASSKVCHKSDAFKKSTELFSKIASSKLFSLRFSTLSLSSLHSLSGDFSIWG